MVFESLVVELMNKYLGEYIENLDASQLKLGIWGGDAVLENLHVKGDALKDLDLPVQIKSGHIGKLTLKIPWKNLYKEAVEATLDGLFLLTVPNSSVEYDAEKEQKKEQDAKQDQLKAIEEQQLLKLKGTEEKKDGFVEKLATQVIKNLQIHVRNIHIRYEDKMTIKDHPFALGVTLNGLSFETTNENWIPCLLDESVKVIYKMVDLDSLSVYWNQAQDNFLTEKTRAEQLAIFKDTIANKTSIPPHFSYIIKPINLQARLRLNPNPQSDPTTPKIVLSLILEEIGLRMMHDQYHGIMELVESFDKMALNAPFRKFRPTVDVKDNSKLWWHYAFNSVMETGIVRRSDYWSWNHIKTHRQKVRQYKAKYKEKLQQKKPSQSLEDELIKMENDLDVFNITLARQTSEAEVVRAGKTIRSKQSIHQKKKDEESGGSGWFSGFFKKKPKESKKDQAPGDDQAGLDSVMTDDEKASLYSAIGYSEGQIMDDSGFPKSYVGTQLNVELKLVCVELADASVSTNDLLSLRLINVTTLVAQRPSAQGLSVAAHMSSFEVDGQTQDSHKPCIVSSDIDSSVVPEKQHLLTVLFEVNPLDEVCDQRIIVNSQPLQIVYDAVTINNLLKFFQPPENVQLQQLRTVAASAYDEIKDQTATGLQHVMLNRNVLEIGIRLASSYVVVPRNGAFTDDPDVLVLDLGELSLESDNQGRTPMLKKGKRDAFAWTQQIKEDESLDLEEMRSKVYDNFTIDLKKIQLLLARSGEDWRSARKLDTSSLHVLEPINLQVLLQKCMVTNDAALPKMKINGEIPLLSVRMSERKLQDALALGESIPLPEAGPEQEQAEMEVVKQWKTISKVEKNEMTLANALAESASKEVNSDEEEFFTAESDLGSDADDKVLKKAMVRQDTIEKQMTDLELTFSIKQMSVTITEELTLSGGGDLLVLRIGTISLSLSMRTWDTTVLLYLNSISAQMMQYTEPGGSPLYLLDSSAVPGSKHLLHVEVLQVKQQSPDFESVHNKTEQKILVKFGTIKLSLHAQATKKLMEFAQTLANIQGGSKDEQEQGVGEEEVKEERAKEVEAIASDATIGTFSDESFVSARSSREIPKDKSIINLHVEAQLSSIDVAILDEKKFIMDLKVEGVHSSVIMTSEFMNLKARLRDVAITDSSPDTRYKRIVGAVGDDVTSDDVFVLELTNYNSATQGQEDNMEAVDTRIKLKMGATRVVFLNKFVQSVIGFASNFSEAKQAALEAGAAAQERAAEEAMKLAETNPRVSLDVTLSAPTVVIPVNSRSLEALAVDLGVLRVSNKFLVAGTGSTGPAVTDHMTISLSNMKITTCSLDDDLKLNTETTMLEPVTIGVDIVRNLSATWFHEVADVAIDGRVPPINLCVSQSDLSSVMTVLDKNLNEGGGEIAQLQPNKVAKQVESSKDLAKKSSTNFASKSEQQIVVTQIWETLKVFFQLDSVNLQLFEDKYHKVSLARVELLRFVAKVTMRNDASTDVDVCLGELGLIDRRDSHKDGINKLIRNRKSDDDNVKIVSAILAQKADGSMEVTASVSGVSAIISAEFISRLVSFFTDPMKPKEAVKSITTPDDEETITATTEVEVFASNEEKTIEEVEEIVQAEKSKSLKVSFSLEEPEIVLVTDVRSLASEALVLGMGANVQFEITPDGKKQMLSAELTKLSLTGCSFNHVMLRSTPNPFTHKKILAPCDIKVAGLISEDIQDFDVLVGEIRLNASPIIINTISQVAAHMSPPADETKSTAEVERRSRLIENLWSPIKNEDLKAWFMRDDSSSVDVKKDPVEVATPKQETAKVDLPLLHIQLETGRGHHTVPLLITECTLKGNVSNWSSGEMGGDFTLTLGTAYFNDSLSVWEPLIEPVEVDSGALVPKYEPWRVEAHIQQSKPTEEDAVNANLPALMSVSVESKQLLQATISNAALKAVNGLGTAFKDAALIQKLSGPGGTNGTTADGADDVQSGAAIVVKNKLGYDVTIDFGKALCLVGKAHHHHNGYKLNNGTKLRLDYSQTGDQGLWAVLSDQEKMARRDDVTIGVHGDANHVTRVNVSHTGAMTQTLRISEKPVTFDVLVASVAGIRTVTLQSKVVLFNHMSISLGVYRKSPFTQLGVIKPDKKFPIPHQYLGDGSVLMEPIMENNKVGPCEVSWKEVLATPGFHSELFQRCAPKNKNSEAVFVNLEFEDKKHLNASGVKSEQSSLSVHLRPSVSFRNFLPFPVQFHVSGVAYEGRSKELQAGGTTQVLDAEVEKSFLKVEVSNQRNTDWQASVQVKSGMLELTPWIFKDTKDEKNTMTLAKQISYVNGMIQVTLYSPYWLVNKTGLPLDYKSSDDNADKAIQHGENEREAMLFSYTSKSFLSANKFQLRVCNSSFSDNFSLDTVGSSGSIVCKTKDFNYIVGIQISLTSFSLTKLITFTPYFSLRNKSDFDLELSEIKPDTWLKVESGEKVTLWPENKDHCLVARIKGNEQSVSTKFRFDKLDSGVLLRVGDHSLFVEVAVTEASVEISLRNYFAGASALLVVNDTHDLSFECWQSKQDEGKQSVFTSSSRHILWSSPTEKREMTWRSSSGNQESIDVFREQTGNFIATGKTGGQKLVETIRHKISSTGGSNKVYFVLFVDGLQRVLLFTSSEDRAKSAQASLQFERSSFELTLALHGVACSLTDSSAHREVAFLALTSSGLVWEEKPNRRWKPLATKFSQLLETEYQKKQSGANIPELVGLDKHEFNLGEMRVTKPHSCPLQRSFTPGLYLQFASSNTQVSVHAKINRMQMDSQISGATFPVMLHPIPLPRSIAIDSTPKPFVEFSLIQRSSENHSFTHIKHLQLLVQEFSVKLDMGLISALLPIFGAEEVKVTPQQELQYFKDDLSTALSEIQSDDDSAGSSVIFYDYLHLSPIKVHVSFSMQNQSSDDKGHSSQGGATEVAKLPFNAFSVVLQSVGVTVSDVDDIVFKLAYYERKFQFMSSSQLTSAVTLHYAGQAIKQLYVLVLGLDVIGNPYGLVMGIAEGVTSLFYEPYQGIIQGPGEFFEGLGLGALSLLGHTVGGAAGAVSKVTGALGKGIASMTMDDDFQKKRLEAKNKQPADVKEGLARGGKGFVMGFVGGVTGIVTKPVEGAKKEGAAGFFKGVGKGLIGVVARPVSGVVDLASSTFEGIQKVADMSEDVGRIRPARWIDPSTGIIQPYSLRRAQGAAILQEIERGKFTASNKYLDHVATKKDRKSVLLLTDKMILSTHTGNILGQWTCDWKCFYEELTGPPQLERNSIKFNIKRHKPRSSIKRLKDPQSILRQESQDKLDALQQDFNPLKLAQFAVSFGRSAAGTVASQAKTATRSPFGRMFSKKGLFSRDPPPVQYNSGEANLKMQQQSDVDDQTKTRSLFGKKLITETASFHEAANAEYIHKRIMTKLSDVKSPPEESAESFVSSASSSSN